MDYSNFASLPKQSRKTDKADSNSAGSTPVTTGSFRGRARNARKLETLPEVEEEISDGHVSSKSSTEDLMQGPGPPVASRVTALKSRFDAQGTNEGGKRWNSHNTELRFNKDIVSSAKLSNGSSSPVRRLSPEGVERPAPAPEMFDLDAVPSIATEERGNRSYRMNEFLDVSSWKIKSSAQEEVKYMETRNTTVQEDAFEVPHSLEIKNILGEPDLKSDEPCSTQSSTPSDGGDFSGPSSPSSLSSSSSVSSNSNSPKTAMFAITGVAKKSDSFHSFSDPPQQRSAEMGSKTSHSVGLQGLKTEFSQQQLALQRPSSNTKDLKPLNSKPQRPSSGVLTSEKSNEAGFSLQARLVKSEAIPTKNENVGSTSRATVLDFSRTGTRPKQFGETIIKQNEESIDSDGKKAARLTEVKAVDTKPEQASKAGDESSTSDGKQLFSVVGTRAAASAVKTGKDQLSRLRFPTGAALNNATPQQEAMFKSELKAHFDGKEEDPTPDTNRKEQLEDTKKPLEYSLEASKRTLTKAPLPWLTQNSNRANDFKFSPGVLESNVDDKAEHALNNDETDNVKSLPDEKRVGTATANTPLIFKPISFRAKKLASEQKSTNTSDNRSQVASPISNSISIRGHSSSLTKITVTPAASFYSARNSANIPEKRSPVPTSKRQRFIYRGMAPTYPEVKGPQASDESSHDASLDRQQYDKFVDKEILDKEITLTNRGQLNKPRKTTRSDAKQVVSSFNIQLSNKSRKQSEEQKVISPSSEEGNGSYASDEKRLNYESVCPTSESSELRFESSRLYYDGGRLGSESARLNNENSGNVGGGDMRKSQLEREPLSQNLFTSSLLKALSPSKQISSSPKAEETFRLNSTAQKLTGSSNDELPQSELSPTNNRPSDNNDEILLQRTPASDHFLQNVVSREMKATRSFPLKVTDVDTGIPVAVKENVGLTRQSHNPISDVSSIAIKDFPVMAKSDHTAKTASGNIASGESAEEAQVPAKNDKKKKARHVSLDPHAVLLDAAVEGELDLVKRIILEVRNPGSHIYTQSVDIQTRKKDLLTICYVPYF